ncbi:MAG: hypothetical protein MK074_06960 [Phycisphaerales bacterium]|nr:hypothetical protein [Phycisphaerales bacterium]
MTMLALLVALLGAPDAQAEDRYYTVSSYAPPQGEVLEVGGLAFLPDGTLAASTRRGRVWLIASPDAEDPSTCDFTMHAEGLWEGLGLNTVGEDVIVLQRTELSRLRDLDGDGVAERIDTLTDDWGLTDNYHEFAFGLPRDADGNLYFSLNLAFINPEWWHGRSNAPWRGWLMRYTPDGVVEPVASGFRSPAGVGIDTHGRLLVTDNQGDWMASSPIFAVEPGGFHGHPASLHWTEAYGHGTTHPENKTPPGEPRTSPAIWIPYDWSRSTGNLVADTTGGAFGPFEDQLFVAELTNGMVLRAELEDVAGVTQGAIWPFKRDVGSACRVEFSPAGNLVVGLTNRGWGGLAPGHGVRRIDWTGELPMEMLHCRAVPGGFDIEFTRPVQGTISASQIEARDYDYHWWWEYGSPEQRKRTMQVESATLSDDGKHLQVRLNDLKAGRVVRMKLNGVTAADGHELLHPEVAYTLNVLPGEGALHHPAKPTDQPKARIAETDAGWLRLTWGDPWDRFRGERNGWRLGKAALGKDNDTAFADEAGHDLLMIDAPGGDDLVIPGALRQGTMSWSMMLPRTGHGAMRLPGGHMLHVRDASTPERTRGHVEIHDGSGAVIAQSTQGWMGPGQWHRVEVDIDGEGVEQVRLQDTAIFDRIAMPVTVEDLRVSGAHAPAGVADIRVKPVVAEAEGESVLREPDRVLGEVDLEVHGGDLYLSGGTGEAVFDVELPATCTITLETRFQPVSKGWISIGQERIVLGEAPDDGSATGSIAGRDEVATRLVADKSWAQVKIQLVPHVAARYCTVSVGGVPVAEGILQADRVSGPIAIGHQAETGWVAVRNLKIK